MAVFQRRLEALAYPHEFNIEDESSIQELVSWLETNNKIKHLPNGPKSITSSCPSSLEEYLKDTGYTQGPERAKQVLWFLSHSLKFEYKDLRYRLPDPSSLSLNTHEPLDKTFVDEVDLHSQELKDAVNDMALKLKMSQHPDHLLTLEACCKYIIKDMALKKLSSQEGNVLQDIESNSFGLQELKDPVVLTSAKILRLLHISSLRDLQTNINQVIVKIQGITADPKTDTSLGKVGR